MYGIISDEEHTEFRVYELPLLYHNLRQKAALESRESPNEVAKYFTLSMALIELEKDKFCYTKGIGCEVLLNWNVLSIY